VVSSISPMKKHAILAVAAFSAFAGCGLFPREEKVLAPPLLTPPEVSYDVVEVKRGSIEDRVTASGTFTPAEQQNLFFRYRGGRIRTLYVHLGDELKPGALVADLDTGSLENRIAQLKILLRKTEINVERLGALNRDRYERELAGLDVELARLQLEDSQAELEQSRLYTPIAGVVVYLTQVKEGDTVDAYRTVAQVADPRRLQLIYKGDNASDFRVGMKVSVRYRDRAFTGEVVMAPGTTPPDAPEDLKNAVIVRLPQLPADIGRGDSATISVVLARGDNVIVLPRDLVHQYLGRNFVQVMENGVKTERTIELGLQTATEVEIVKGLSPGEQVVSR